MNDSVLDDNIHDVLPPAPRGWRRSRRGNLWRRLGKRGALVVFQEESGAYRWVRNDPQSVKPPIFSEMTFGCELDAVYACMNSLHPRRR